MSENKERELEFEYQDTESGEDTDTMRTPYDLAAERIAQRRIKSGAHAKDKK